MQESSRADRFLGLYRVLEGMLEKRYANHRMSSGSVVMEYLREADSEPCRAELDLCREIRNLLTHNTDSAGGAVVEPSEAILKSLEAVIERVQRPRMAIDYGTPRENILFAHPNDSAINLMRHMLRMGYSHVPVRDRTGLVGVFSSSCLMAYIGQQGFDGLSDALRVGDLKAATSLEGQRGGKYLFLPPDAMLLEVRDAFERRRERNSRLAAVFITEDGTSRSEVLAMLTPWDVLKDTQ